MVRRLRIKLAGAIYHATVRGNARRKIFPDDRDGERFLRCLAESVEAHNVRLHPYCLMPNHFHGVV